MSEDWKTYLTPHLTYVVQNLRPVLVLDKLREKQLLASEECTQLHNVWRQASDQECCRQLLDILFKKGPDSFRRFLEVLRSIPGQEHIANKMKPMDTSSSSVSEQQDRKSHLDDVSVIATVKMYPPSSSQQRELPMVSSEQEELLLQSLIAVIADVRPTLLLDDLRWYSILTEEEYKQLQQGSLTESERSHRLLHDILPSKSKGSVTVFCEVLDQIEGQKHLLKGETEATSLGKVTEVEVVGQSHRSRPNGNGAASKEDLLPRTEHMDGQQGMASVLNQDVPSTSKKRKQCSTSCPPSTVSHRNFATFFFKPELEELIAPMENLIGSMCAASFGIEKKFIMCAYTKMADLYPILKGWGHPCFMDLDSKLAVLVVHGTKQPVDTDTRKILEGLIVTHLQKINPNLELPPGECSVVEIITGSSFILLSLSMNLYISLLCVLGNKELRTELSRLLNEALPGSNKAIFRLGGLPPLVLFNDLTDTHNSGEDQGGAVATEKTPVVASKENYGNVLDERDVSTVVQKESDPALEGHMSSLQDSTIERQSADVHKLLLAESSRDTSKDQFSDDGNLLGATNVTSATQSEFQQPILHEQKTPQEHSAVAKQGQIKDKGAKSTTFERVQPQQPRKQRIYAKEDVKMACLEPPTALRDNNPFSEQRQLFSAQISTMSLLETVVRRITSHDQSPTLAASETSGNHPYLRFRQEVIDRGKVVCWICFFKDGGILNEQDSVTDRCPAHVVKKWTPTLVWRNKPGSGKEWVGVRPRHPNSRRAGPFRKCNRGPDCGGALNCQRPHSKTEEDAWTLDRDGVIWKHRPPSSRYSLNICRNYQRLNGKCPYKDGCHYAHGQEELLEWQEFDKRRMQQTSQQKSWRSRLSHELIDKLKSDTPSNEVVTDQSDSVQTACPYHAIAVSESKPFVSTFHIEITHDIDPNHRIRKAVLLRGDSVFKFAPERSQEPCFSLSDDCTELIIVDDCLKESHSVTVSVNFESNQDGSFPCDVVIDFGQLPYLIQTLRVDVANTANLAALKQLQMSSRPKDGHWHVHESQIVYPNAQKVPEGMVYRIPDAASLGDDVNRLGILGDCVELTKDRYKPVFHALISLEELHSQEFLRSFSARNVPMVTDDNEKIRGVWTVTLNRPVPSRTAQIALIRPTGSETAYAVPVMSVQDDTLEIDVAANADLAKRVSTVQTVNVDFQFQQDNTHFSQLHRSVNSLQDTIIVTHLLGVSSQSRSGTFRIRRAPEDSLKLLDTEICSNRKQTKAVSMILAHSLPFPFIINGPFGTGKTRLLAEAIRLLTLTRENLRVLVCTQSNNAADLYVKSFDEFTEEGRFKARVMRICYPFRRLGTVPKVVQKYCDYMEAERQFMMPSYDELDSSADNLVVVTTLITSAQLMDIGLRSGYFTHIVIDEAAQATEPESVTPLALAGPRTAIVLAGDCRQISPPVQSPWARRGKLQRSLFRRLYKTQPEQFQVNLMTNYRCNYDILRLTSSLFYGLDDVSADYCKADDRTAHPDYHSFSFIAVVDGYAEQGGEDGSYMNPKEASVAVDHLQNILTKWPADWGPVEEADVCVVTSEYRQVQYIRQLLRRTSRSLSRVSVLTSRSIQGKEFRAVVLSTVMTDRHYTEIYDRQPNFLSNAKMLNTAITRAKSLVIVIGDPDCLVRSKIGPKWERYLAECYEAGPKGLMGDRDESEAVKRIVVEASKLNVAAEEFVPDYSKVTSRSDTSSAQTAEGSQLNLDIDLHSKVNDEDEDESSSDSSDSGQYSEGESSGPDMEACLESDEEDQFGNCNFIDDDYLDDPMSAGLRLKGRRVYYHRHRDKVKMLHLLKTDPDTYVRCILKVASDGENAFGIFPDGSKSDIRIEGRRRRNRAFEGEEVLVELLPNLHRNPESTGEEIKRGRVIGIFRRQRPSQFICQLYEHTTHMLAPLERGHPIFINRKSDKSHTDCGGCVVLYDCSRNLRGKVHKPVERECLSVEQATGKLFVVQYLGWSVSHRYPTGIVSNYIDRGLNYTLGQRVLGIQFSIPEVLSASEGVTDMDVVPPVDTSHQEGIITTAFTIDPEHSRDLDDALAVMEYDPDRNICVVGVFIADVSHFVPKDSRLDKDARKIGMTVYDEAGRQLCPMLPERLSSNDCSLLQGKDRPVLAVFEKYNTLTGETTGDPVRFERRTIRSSCQMSYRDAQMIIDDTIPQLHCAKGSQDAIIRDVQILYRLSSKLRRERLKSAMLYRDVDRTDDALAHELVEEFMVRTNRIVAEQLLQSCPRITPLVSQWEPKRKLIEQLFKSCGNLSTMSCRLSVLSDVYKTTSGSAVDTQVVCPRLHVTKTTLETIKQALFSRRFEEVIAAVCTEGFHPQLALAISKFLRTQQKAAYVCSDDNDMSVLKHWHLDCYYTHFTSPIRRYIDLICHRLVRQYLLCDNSMTKQYDEEEMQEICSHATFRRINMRKFQRELEMLKFSFQIHKDPIATVAVIEEIGSGHIDLFVPYCPHIARRYLQVRLSALSASGCDRKNVDGIPSLAISWSFDMLPLDKNRKLKLPEDDYRSISSKLWRKLASEVSSPGKADERRYRTCEQVISQILEDEETSEDHAASRNKRSPPTKATATPSSPVNGKDSEGARRVISTVDSCSDNDSEGEEGFAVVRYRRGRILHEREGATERKITYTSTQGGRRRREHRKETTEKLMLFGLVSVQLCSKMIRGLLRPIVQLINFPSGISICVEHNKYPSDCFADIPSSAGALIASKRSYRNLFDYKMAWIPLVEIEAATGSVRASSTGTPVLLYDLLISWTKRGNNLVGSVTFDANFALEKKIACKKDDYACLRYFNLPPSVHDTESYGEGATSALLKSRSTSQLVCHCKISSGSDPKPSESSSAFGRQLTLDVKGAETDNGLAASNQTLEDIVIDLEPYYQERDIKKTLLAVTEKPCIAHMIHLGLPYRRMKKALESVEKEVKENRIVMETVCGTFRGIRTGKIPKTNDEEGGRFRLSLRALLSGSTLNTGQYTAVRLALEQDVTLIQGPPGTGKTVTGVHIACWFVAKNKKLMENTRQLGQVMYCAPSNEAVDLVTRCLRKVVKQTGIRILRVYGKSIEQAAYPGPAIFEVYAPAGLPVTMTEESEDLEDLSLHRRIRNPKHSSKANDITAMEANFKEMKEKDDIPTREEVGKYRTLVHEAEQAEITVAHIVLCTCMQAGSYRLKRHARILQCIVDEAGQCTEPETLVALARSSLQRIVLIGDHKQLQPVVLDQTVKDQLCISMFERLATDRTFMLTEQYRMHKNICKFPSEQFYEGKLVTPEEVSKRPHVGESLWQGLEFRACKPKCFIHLEGVEEVNPVAEKGKGGEESRYNKTEVTAIITLVNIMVSPRHRHRIPQESIRVLTPYTAQKKAIEKELREQKSRNCVQVSSISASQGGEADIIILSTVRSLPRDLIVEDPTRSWISDHLGFVTDPHQINVALTRAKHGLFILGNRHLLEVNKMWKKLICHYEKDGCLVTNPDSDRLATLF